jgi:hypothetical protein
LSNFPTSVGIAYGLVIAALKGSMKIPLVLCSERGEEEQKTSMEVNVEK